MIIQMNMIKLKMRETQMIIINNQIIKMIYKRIKNIFNSLMKINKKMKQFNQSKIKNNKGSLT